METTNDQPVQNLQESETKRLGFFQRLRRNFSSIFRRNNRKQNKSDSQTPVKSESAPNPTEIVNASLIDEHSPENIETPADIVCPTKSAEINGKPHAKSALVGNDFTSELKQSLRLRSRKIEEGEKSPTDVIKQIEEIRTLNSVIFDNKDDVKIEVETKTFEEKLALFESQISGGSGSVQDTLKRDKSEMGDNGDEEEFDDYKEENGKEEEETLEESRENDGAEVVERVQENGEEGADVMEIEADVTNYTIDVLEDIGGNIDRGSGPQCGMVDGDRIAETYVVNEDGEKNMEEISVLKSNGNVSKHEDKNDFREKDVSGFVNQLIENASNVVCPREPECVAILHSSGAADVQ